MLLIQRKVCFKTIKQKYNYRFLVKKRKDIFKESNLKKKQRKTLALASEILTHIFILDLFAQEQEAEKETKILVSIVLSWSFKPDKISKVLKFLIFCLAIYKLNYKNSLLLKKKKRNRKILKFLAGIIFAVLIIYNSLFNSPKLEKNSNELEYIPTAIDRLGWRYEDSLLIFNEQNQYVNIKENDGIKIPSKRLPMHDFKSNKRLEIDPRQIPLDKRTSTLQTLNKKLKKKEEEKKLLEIREIRKKIQFKFIKEIKIFKYITFVSHNKDVNYNISEDVEKQYIRPNCVASKIIFTKHSLDGFASKGFIIKDSDSNLYYLKEWQNKLQQEWKCKCIIKISKIDPRQIPLDERTSTLKTLNNNLYKCICEDC